MRRWIAPLLLIATCGGAPAPTQRGAIGTTFHPPAGAAVGASAQSFVLTSHGALTDYVVGTVRLFNSSGTNVIGGNNWTTQSIYLGAGNVDARFASVRFTVGGNPIKYRRFNVRNGVSADFMLQVTMPASGTITVDVTSSVSIGAGTLSTDEIVTWWGVDGWERVNGTGLVNLNTQAAEPTLIAEGNKLRAWVTHELPVGDGISTSNISYTESLDGGATWSALATCIADLGTVANPPYPVRTPAVAKGPDNLYHMLLDHGGKGLFTTGGGQQTAYYTSPSGDCPGTWTKVTDDIWGGTGPGPGNLNLIYTASDGKWHVWEEFWGAIFGGPATWITQHAQGTTLQTLAFTDALGTPIDNGSGNGRYNFNPNSVLPNPVGSTWVNFGHGGPTTPLADMPSSVAYWTAPAVTGPWTRGPWTLIQGPYMGSMDGSNNPIPDTWDLAQPTNSQSQLADSSVVEFNGQTLALYEDIYQQAGLPAGYRHLAMAKWDAPLARLINSTVTHSKGDDVLSEGWVIPDPLGSAWDFWSSFANTWVRKSSKFSTRTRPKAKNPSTQEWVNTAAGNFLAKRAFTNPTNEMTLQMVARIDALTGAYFVPTDLYGTAGGNFLLWIFFEQAGGKICYVKGAGQACGPSYTLGQEYEIRADFKTTGYDLYIDGVLIEAGIAYRNAWSKPDTYRVLMNGALHGYINHLVITKWDANAPTWGP